MKLSMAQQEIIDKMSNGWELGFAESFNCRFWLQKGGCGKGGETKGVRSTTVASLQGKGLIEIAKKGYPLSTYKLAQAAT